jgi:hypothetical protein
VAYNFQTENNKMKLLTEYEILNQKVLFFVKQNFLSYTFIFRKQFFFSNLRIIGHENPDNNLESHCITILNAMFVFCLIHILSHYDIFPVAYGHQQVYVSHAKLL